MLIGRVVLMVISLLVAARSGPDVLLADAILPPLERYVDLISLTFLVLAFVPLLRERGQLGLGLTAIMLVAATIFYAVSATQWYNLSAVPNQFYNATPQETIWQAWSLAVAALAAVAVWLKRDDTVGVVFAAFLTLAIGSGLQLVLGHAQSNVAGWVRLAQLIAYPVFAVVVYQITEAAATPQLVAPPSYPLLPARSEATEQAWFTLTTIQNLSTGPDAGRLAAAHGCCPGAISAGRPLRDRVVEQQRQRDRSTRRASSRRCPTRGARHPARSVPVDPARARNAPGAHPRQDQRARPRVSNLYGLLGSFIVGPTIIAPLDRRSKPAGHRAAGQSRQRTQLVAGGCGARADAGRSHGVDADGARESPALCAAH